MTKKNEVANAAKDRSDYKMPWLIDCWKGGDDEIVLD